MKKINWSVLCALFVMLTCLQFCKKDEATPTPTPTVYYKVTLNYNGKDTTNSTLTFSGTALTLPSPARTGYTLNGWYDAATAGNKITSPYTPTKDITLYAQWTANTNTIKFNTNGGNTIADTSITSGEKLKTPTAPTKAGYTFDKWYTDAALTTAYDFTATVTSGFTLYAKWTGNANTITFNTNGGNDIANVSITSGTALTAPTTPTKAGYTFDKWYTDANLTTAYNFATIVTNSFTLYAKWTANTNTIKFNTNGGNTIADTSITSGEKLKTPTAPTKAGYTFDKWYTDAALTTAYNFAAIVTNSFTLYAKWTVSTYTVTFSLLNGGTAGAGTDYTQSIAHNNNAQAPANPPTRAGYTFAGWFEAASGGTAVTTFGPITAAKTYYAQYIINTYTVTFDVNGGAGAGTDYTKSIVYNNNTQAPFNPPTREGYTFAGWYSSASGGRAVTIFGPITAAKTYYAQWGVVINSKIYRTVTIGTQTWLAQNLNDDSHTAGISSCYNNYEGNCTTYGRLYNWDAAMDIDAQILGWHLPTQAEWQTLRDFLGGENLAGGKMKANGGSGFEAIMGGYQTSDGNTSGNLGLNTDFWSATVDGSNNPFRANLGFSHSILDIVAIDKGYRFSVRLVKD